MGQLGLDPTIDHTDSIMYLASDVCAVSAGQSHSLFLKKDGTLYVMGNGESGQLGDGCFRNRARPVAVSSRVTAIAASADASFFVTDDGRLWTVGFSDDVHIQSLSVIDQDVWKVFAGYSNALYIKTNGSLWAFGDNYGGQMGNESISSFGRDLYHIADNVKEASAGYGFNLFVKTDGTLWAIGSNSYGQLGIGTTTRQLAPVKVQNGVESVSAGSNHSIFMTKDGSVYGMGYTRYGELGINDSEKQTTPILIYAP